MVRATGVGVIDALSLSLSRSCAPIVRRVASKRRRRRRWSNFVVINFCLVSSQPPFLEMDKKEMLSRREKKEDGNEREKKSTQRNHNLSPL